MVYPPRSKSPPQTLPKPTGRRSKARVGGRRHFCGKSSVYVAGHNTPAGGKLTAGKGHGCADGGVHRLSKGVRRGPPQIFSPLFLAADPERLYLTQRYASFITGDSESGVRPQAFVIIDG